MRQIIYLYIYIYIQLFAWSRGTVHCRTTPRTFSIWRAWLATRTTLSRFSTTPALVSSPRHTSQWTIHRENFATFVDILGSTRYHYPCGSTGLPYPSVSALVRRLPSQSSCLDGPVPSGVLPAPLVLSSLQSPSPDNTKSVSSPRIKSFSLPRTKSVSLTLCLTCVESLRALFLGLSCSPYTCFP